LWCFSADLSVVVMVVGRAEMVVGCWCRNQVVVVVAGDDVVLWW
jgi:hypothetical protein